MKGLKRVSISHFGDVAITWLYALFAIVWLVGFSNAVNLTDGLDGLVAGLTLIATGTYAIIAAHDGRTDVLIVCLTTMGAMIGFLMFNTSQPRFLWVMWGAWHWAVCLL